LSEGKYYSGVIPIRVQEVAALINGNDAFQKTISGRPILAAHQDMAMAQCISGTFLEIAPGMQC